MSQLNAALESLGFQSRVKYYEPLEPSKAASISETIEQVERDLGLPPIKPEEAAPAVKMVMTGNTVPAEGQEDGDAVVIGEPL
jgi:hypothetical protein